MSVGRRRLRAVSLFSVVRRAKRETREWPRARRCSGSETHNNVLAAALDGLTREVKQQRRRRQQERQKSNTFNRQNNNFARVSRFFVHFFAVTTGPQYDGKLPNFYGIRAMNFETAR